MARAADGSLRDALSLLDQLIAFAGGKLTEAEARAMLGTIDRGHTVRLLELLANGDAAAVVAEVAAQEEFSPDYGSALDELASLIQKVALRQAVPGYEAGEFFPAQTLDALAASISAEDLQLFYQIAILGRRDLDLAPDPRGGFEMILLRMLAFRPALSTQSVSSSRGAATLSGSPPAGNAAPRETRPAASFDSQSWPSILGALDVQGAARQLAANCALLGRQDSEIRLQLDPRGAHYRSRQNEELLAQSLGRLMGGPIRLSIDTGEPPEETPARQQQRGRRAAPAGRARGAGGRSDGAGH